MYKCLRFDYWIIVSIKFGPNVILRICSEATSAFAKLFKTNYCVQILTHSYKW